MALRFYAMDSELLLAQVKLELRDSATRAIELRANPETTRREAEAWSDGAAALLRSRIGDWGESEFRRCTEGTGSVDLEEPDGLRAYLWVHSQYLKDLAAGLTASDLRSLES